MANIITNCVSPASTSLITNVNTNTNCIIRASQLHIGSTNNISHSSGSVNNQITSILSMNSPTKEIVRICSDGSVKWNDEIQIDAAAEALSKSLKLGVEIAAGITSRVKKEIRNSVFEDLITLAKEKGTLTADDVEYALRCCKIMDKLYEK